MGYRYKTKVMGPNKNIVVGHIYYILYICGAFTIMLPPGDYIWGINIRQSYGAQKKTLLWGKCIYVIYICGTFTIVLPPVNYIWGINIRQSYGAQ